MSLWESSWSYLEFWYFKWVSKCSYLLAYKQIFHGKYFLQRIGRLLLILPEPGLQTKWNRKVWASSNNIPVVCSHLIMHQVGIFSLDKMGFPTQCHSTLSCCSPISIKKSWVWCFKSHLSSAKLICQSLSAAVKLPPTAYQPHVPQTHTHTDGLPLSHTALQLAYFWQAIGFPLHLTQCFNFSSVPFRTVGYHFSSSRFCSICI